MTIDLQKLKEEKAGESRIRTELQKNYPDRDDLLAFCVQENLVVKTYWSTLRIYMSASQQLSSRFMYQRIAGE